jgi:iron-sulfur cluster assembly accessory protein|tara:strand:- start:2050 stop:2394 length:345 start_codon:yes stop_codon:yes gene_type:complete
MEITVTDIAQTRLNELVGEHIQDGQAIRVFLGGGGCGCSGPSFGMGVDTKTDEDTLISIGDLNFIIDGDSSESLEGASIDYVEDVMQQGFKIEAPNAPQGGGGGGGCGCGGGGH